MNEDTKTKLEEKKDAVVGEDELEKVAGGTTDQNYDILTALMKLDRSGVKAVLDKAGALSNEGQASLAEMALCEGAGKLLQKHLGVSGGGLRFIDNVYRYNGESISHDRVLGMIDEKVKAAEKEGFVLVP